MLLLSFCWHTVTQLCQAMPGYAYARPPDLTRGQDLHTALGRSCLMQRWGESSHFDIFWSIRGQFWKQKQNRNIQMPCSIGSTTLVPPANQTKVLPYEHVLTTYFPCYSHEMPWRCWMLAEAAIHCNDPPIAKHLVSRMELDARLYEHSKWASFLSPLPHRRLRRPALTYGDYSRPKSSVTTDSAIISFSLWELSRHPEGMRNSLKQVFPIRGMHLSVLLRTNSTFEFFHPSTGCLKEPVKKRKSLFKGRFTGGKSFPSSCISSNAWRSTCCSSSVHPQPHSIASHNSSRSTSELPSIKYPSVSEFPFSKL